MMQVHLIIWEPLLKPTIEGYICICDDINTAALPKV